MKRTILLFSLFLSIISIQAQEIAQWRGAERDGKYPDKDLLKSWGENGPDLLWHYDDLGDGHASASVMNDLVYTAGTDTAGNGFVIALSHKGEKVWQSVYGKEWMESYEGARSTPVIFEGKVYVVSSYGQLACMNADNGNIIWKKDLFTDYDGINIKWGVTENLLIDGDILYCTPGGKKANVLALNKDNGDFIWECPGLGEGSAYCSPLMVELNNKKLLVTQTEKSVLGIDAHSGELLWSYEHINRWSVQPNTPLYKNGMLYIVSGYGKGGVMLKLAEDGKSVSKVWENTSLDNKMGGVILQDGRIYGSGDANKKWFCLDWETGEELYSSKMLRVGNIIYADDLLYCYGTGGKVGIVDPKTNDYALLSSFKVPYGHKQHWAHLVIHNKVLYVRHGHSIMAYDIAEK